MMGISRRFLHERNKIQHFLDIIPNEGVILPVYDTFIMPIYREGKTTRIGLGSLQSNASEVPECTTVQREARDRSAAILSARGNNVHEQFAKGSGVALACPPNEVQQDFRNSNSVEQ